jgi:gluconate 2-dehydrogenase gamma chain
MKRSEKLERRAFLGATAAAAASAATGCGSREWRFFTETEARTLAAVCDRIVPPDEYPGAAQAGAVRFIDRQLLRHFRPFRTLYRDGLRLLASRSFASLPPAAQDAILKAFEAGTNTLEREFFNAAVQHTMQSYYGTPRHGGNRDAVSWRMLGVPEPPLRGRDVPKAVTS